MCSKTEHMASSSSCPAKDRTCKTVAGKDNLPGPSSVKAQLYGGKSRRDKRGYVCCEGKIRNTKMWSDCFG